MNEPKPIPQARDEGNRLFTSGPTTQSAPAVNTDGPDTVAFRRSNRARQYRLWVDRDGSAEVVIPRSGSERGARRFLDRHRDWLRKARQRAASRPRPPEEWRLGTQVWWRGAREMLEADPGDGEDCRVRLRSEVFRVPSFEGDLRPTLEKAFRHRAAIELPARTWELATIWACDLKRVAVRDQRSRWGSCSTAGTISLNWRLLQSPEGVRDYIILHELMHLREMNHSPRFWRLVERACPDWRESEDWLRQFGPWLGF